MFSAAMCPLQIKDLKDLRALLCRRVTIDMQDLKDLKRCFRAGARGGQAPALREHRDQEVSPTGKASKYETPSELSVVSSGRRDILVPIRCASRPGDLSYRVPKR